MRAVICGYYGMGNAGDEALLATLLQMLPKHIEPIVLSGNPQATRQAYEVEACDRFSPTAVWSAVRSAKVFIFGGGSLMQDTTSWLSPIYYGSLMFLAQKLGLITIAWAQGIGPLKRPPIRWLSCLLFRGCSAVSVRDSRSSDLLNQWHVAHQLGPDPVWALQAEPSATIAGTPQPRIAVNLRPHPSLTPKRLDLLSHALAALQHELDASILLIPFQPQVDTAIAKTLQKQLRQPVKILQFSTPQQLKGIFQRVDLTISMRLHGLIMAAAEGSRCFALSYDPKVSALIADLQLSGLNLECLSGVPEELSEHWLEIYRRPVTTQNRQTQALPQQAYLHQQLLHEALKSG